MWRIFVAFALGYFLSLMHFELCKLGARIYLTHATGAKFKFIFTNTKENTCMMGFIRCSGRFISKLLLFELTTNHFYFLRI